MLTSSLLGVKRLLSLLLESDRLALEPRLADLLSSGKFWKYSKHKTPQVTAGKNSSASSRPHTLQDCTELHVSCVHFHSGFHTFLDSLFLLLVIYGLFFCRYVVHFSLWSVLCVSSRQAWSRQRQHDSAPQFCSASMTRILQCCRQCGRLCFTSCRQSQ